METESGFRRFQSLAALPDAGLDVTIDAKPQERAGLAVYLGVDRVDAVRAKLTLTRWRAHGVRVTGQVTAKLTQTCVVTLEPLAQTIAAEVDRKFLPEAMLGEEAGAHELLIDPDGDDPPEPLPHTLDLGALAAEELALNVDPYPRKEGLPEAAPEDVEPPPESPFAILKKLK
jgi:uncharacterized metal-binding protein YceD (DUF177 family)